MQYILSEQEYNKLCQTQEKYLALKQDLEKAFEEAKQIAYQQEVVQLATTTLSEMIRRKGSRCFDGIEKHHWTWVNPDGELALCGQFLADFEKTLTQKLDL